MAEALSNLICNAIIHSQSPDVIVSVERAQGGVRVAVEDQGSGDVTVESVPGKGTRFTLTIRWRIRATLSGSE